MSGNREEGIGNREQVAGVRFLASAKKMPLGCWLTGSCSPERGATEATRRKSKAEIGRCPERGRVEEWINRRFEIGDCNLRAVWGAGDAQLRECGKPVARSGYDHGTVPQQVSGFRCQVSGVRCQVSGVRCQGTGNKEQRTGNEFQALGVREAGRDSSLRSERVTFLNLTEKWH